MEEDHLETGDTAEAPATSTLPDDNSHGHSGTSASTVLSDSGKWDKYLPLDATDPRGCWNWAQLKYFLIPMELAVFLYMFTTYFHFQIYQQYFLQQSARNALNLSSNYSGCLNQTGISEMSSNETFFSIQSNANHVLMITTVVAQAPSLFVFFLLGALSDRFGRKVVMYIVFAGQCVSSVIGLLIVYFNLNMYFFLLSGFASGITGGFGAILLTGFSYIADITPEHWLTVRSGFLQVAIFVGTAASSGSSNSWLGSNGCDFLPPVWLLVAVTVVGFLYVVITPESLTREKRATLPKRGVGFILMGIKIFFWPRHLGRSRLWRLWLVLVVMSIAVINEVGNVEILTYFLENKPLKWPLGRISLYTVVISVTHCLALVVVVPLLVFLKLPDPLISLIGVTVACGVSTIFGFAESYWPYSIIFAGKGRVCVRVCARARI